MNSAASPSKHWPGIGFVLCAAVLGMFAGGFLGKLSVDTSDGLAGAATVLGYAALGLVLALIIAIVLVRRLERGTLVHVLLVIGPLVLIMLALSTKRFMDQKAVQDEQWEEEQERMRRMKPTAPTGSGLFASLARASDVDLYASVSDLPMGIGMASPHLVPGVLRMYGQPDLFDPFHRPAVSDSVVFVQGEHHVEISYAPPWFVPAHMKLDYDLLLLRALTVSQNWIEVVVNEHDGRTAWILRHDLELRLWHAFLLSVVAVETLDPATNPIRIKPLDHAAILADGANALLKPLAVRGDWLLVETHQMADRIQPTGWIRWREGDRLLVDYSLLC